MIFTDEKLAIHGGSPVRTQPLPEESSGIHYFNDEEIRNVTAVLQARSPFRFYGPQVQHMCDQLENSVREKFNVNHVIGVSSGTEALYIGLAACEVGPGDEVLLPGYLWTSCLNAIVRLGAIPKLVDIDDTFTMSPIDLKKKITKHSKALIYINMSGAPGHIDKIMAIAREHGLRVVEDNAQAFGATFNGKSTGTFGDIAIQSFQINKSITSGEGGLIMTNDKHLYSRCFGIHDLGYARNEIGILMDTSCDEMYHLWGCGARMSELHGAVLLAQFNKLDQIVKHMHRSKYTIKKELETIPGLSFRTIVDTEGDSSSFLIFALPNSAMCDEFIAAMKAEGIKGRGYGKPLISMKEWGLHWYFNNKSLVNKKSLTPSGWPWTLQENAFAKEYHYDKGTLPACDDYWARAGLLKVPSNLEDGDVEDIIRAFKKVASHVIK